MKRIILIGAIASLLSLAGCANNPCCAPEPMKPACDTCPAPVHQDYKGECAK